jgi:hypothetical protein
LCPKDSCDEVLKMHNKVLFDVGYKAKFETTGTMLLTFELLDQKMVLLLIWRESFAEYPMANQGGTF